MRALATTREELSWLIQRTDCALTAHARGIKAIDEEHRILGMVAFDGWTEFSVQAHMAVDSPLAWRVLLPAAFSYAFEEAGKGLLLGAIPSHNKKSLRFAKHAGLTEAFRIQDGWARGDDLVVLELRKENCRWLHGQRKAA